MPHEYHEHDEKARRRRRNSGDVVGGAMPRWFSVMLLALLVYLLRWYAEGIQRTLESHSDRIGAIELWRAAAEARSKP